MEYKLFAKKYHDIGFNVSCVSYLKTKYNINETNPEKAPNHPWIDLQIRRQHVDELEKYNWQFSNGVGCILGFGKIKCIDIDGCNDIATVNVILMKLNLPKDYEWVIKTPNGFHIYILSDEFWLSHKVLKNGILALTPNDKYKSNLKQIEYRWAGHCMLPPSKISSNQYKFLNISSFPEKIPEYVNLRYVFDSMCEISGTTYEHKKENKPNEVRSYRGELKIENYNFVIAWGSDFMPYLEQHNNDELVFEVSNDYTISTGSNKYELPNTLHYHKKPKKIMFFDIETTGLIGNPLDYLNYPRMIQIAIISESDDEIRSYDYYIKPDNFQISNGINKLTGISETFLNENGEQINKVLDRLSWQDEQTMLVSHNIEFDLSIIDSEFLRLNKVNPLRKYSTYCTMKKMSELNNNKKYFKLTELYEFLFKEPVTVQLHNAKQDVKILRDCYKLMDLYGYTK